MSSDGINWLELIFGVVLGGLVGLAVPYATMYFNSLVLAPKIVIFKKFRKAITDDKKKILQFTVKNCGCRQAIGVRFQLHRLTTQRDKKEDELPLETKSLQIPLAPAERNCLEPFDEIGTKDDYYIVVRTKQDFLFSDGANKYDIHQVFSREEDVELRLSVLAKDPVFQVERVYTKIFTAKHEDQGSSAPGGDKGSTIGCPRSRLWKIVRRMRTKGNLPASSSPGAR